MKSFLRGISHEVLRGEFGLTASLHYQLSNHDVQVYRRAYELGSARGTNQSEFTNSTSSS